MRWNRALTPLAASHILSQMLHTQKLQELLVYVSHHSQVSDLGLTKLWKLVFFIDRACLRALGQTITGSEYIKYEHGPVPSRGEKHLRMLCRSEVLECEQRNHCGFKLNEVKALRKPQTDIFSEEELSLADSVCSEFGGHSAKQLSELSHRDPAWHYAEQLQKLSPALMAYGSEEDPDGL